MNYRDLIAKKETCEAKASELMEIKQFDLAQFYARCAKCYEDRAKNMTIVEVCE